MNNKRRQRCRKPFPALIALLLLCVIVQPLSTSRAATFGGSFSLENANGQQVTDKDFRGKFLIVAFGYTNCPDFCPMMLYSIKVALRMMGDKAESVQPIFITVDPARDTPAIIGHYVALFSPRIIGLTGTKAELSQVEAAYHVYVGPTDPKTGAIAHSAMLYIMAPDGSFITALNGNASAQGLANRLAKIIATPSPDLPAQND